MTTQSERWQEEEKVKRYGRQSRIGTSIMYTPFARKIVQSLPTLEEGAIIVDLGTGPGLLVIELYKLWPQARFIGVDPSSEMLNIARENAAGAGMPDFDATLGSAVELPLGPDSVDLVVSQSSFHEWEDQRKGLSEVFRTLKPSGNLILKDYNSAWLTPWKRKLIRPFHHLDMFRYTFQQVTHLLEEAGFEKIEGEEKGVQYLVRSVKPLASQRR
jgi:ubiquinone/menaquinone biosynthesis C-methylase UbiE